MKNNGADSVNSPRRTRDRAATMAAILLAATDEFAEKGLAGARVENIAAQTATSKHMIYYYFESKERLYGAVLERAYEQFGTAEGSVDYDRLEPVEALAALVGATFDVHASSPQIVRIIMAENLNLGVQLKKISNFERRNLALQTLGGILVRGAAEGVMRPELDRMQIHLSISALSFHYIANAHTFGHVFGLDPHGSEDLAARKAEVVRTILLRCQCQVPT